MKRFFVICGLALSASCAPVATPVDEAQPTPQPSPPPAAAPEPTAEAPAAPAEEIPARTIWDGVYTVAQAADGEEVAQRQCTLCHSPQVEWPLTIESWSNRPILDMYNMIMHTMPQTNPGGLSRQQYADVVAYMLQIADVPPGDTPLPTSEEGLAAIMVTRR